MGLEIIRERLRTHFALNPESAEIMALENALKETMQEIALRGLALNGFFQDAIFQGGTCLRILHRMPRFSEDLDFTLGEKKHGYEMAPHLKAVQEELFAFGIDTQVQHDPDKTSAVMKAVIKAPSIEAILGRRSAAGRLRNIRIKVEIDVNPPAGHTTEIKPLLWPSPVSIVAHDIPSLFAGKLHAVLTRPYDKGRDWYDLAWYVQRRAEINFTALKNALVQTSSCDACTSINAETVKEMLIARLEQMNLEQVKADVRPLVPDGREVNMWDKNLFRGIIEQI